LKAKNKGKFTLHMCNAGCSDRESRRVLLFYDGASEPVHPIFIPFQGCIE